MDHKVPLRRRRFLIFPSEIQGFSRFTVFCSHIRGHGVIPEVCRGQHAVTSAVDVAAVNGVVGELVHVDGITPATNLFRVSNTRYRASTRLTQSRGIIGRGAAEALS